MSMGLAADDVVCIRKQAEEGKAIQLADGSNNPSVAWAGGD